MRSPQRVAAQVTAEAAIVRAPRQAKITINTRTEKRSLLKQINKNSMANNDSNNRDSMDMDQQKNKGNKGQSKDKSSQTSSSSGHSSQNSTSMNDEREDDR